MACSDPSRDAVVKAGAVPALVTILRSKDSGAPIEEAAR
jgi:hypothetical protein